MPSLRLAEMLQLDHDDRLAGRAESATMIKARKDNLILLGLSHANLDRLRADGLNGGISIKGADIGVDVDIFITAAPTEAHMLDAIAARIGPETEVRVDKKLKS